MKKNNVVFLDVPYEENEPEVIIENDSTYEISDALPKCLNDRQKVDVQYMSILSGVTKDEIMDIYNEKNIVTIPEEYVINKDKYNCELTTQFLSGANLKTMRDNLLKYNGCFDGIFDPHIRLIDSVMPQMPAINDIHMQLGAGWISEDIIARFIKDLFGLPKAPIIKRFEDKWHIEYPVRPLDVYQTEIYGTKRMNATIILKHILEASTIKIKEEIPFDNVSGYKSVVNKVETLLAHEKEQKIIAEFRKWIRKNKRDIDELVRQYCDKYAYVLPKFDGSFLELSDINPEVSLYKHQKDAVARILLSRKKSGSNTLLAHDVGSGKTYIYIIAVHELYRLGFSKKNMIVVPNNVFNDAVKAHRYLYPQDKLLTISPADFKPGDREKTIEKIKNGDYTAIYICYSKFDMLGMTLDYKISLIDNERRELAIDLRNSTDYWIRNTISSRLDKLKKEEENLLKEYKPDCRNCFDELGIETLVVDECHNYKNVTVDTKLEGIIGLHRKGSAKADLLHDKVRCIQYNKGNIIFCTGTLLTNSIADLYVFQDYLQPKTMKNCAISTFGEWANTFGSITSSFEIDVDSTNYRFMTRLSSYHNLPELMNVFGEVVDFYHISSDDMKLPKFNGYRDVVVERTSYQEIYYKEIVERVEACRSGLVKSTEDNILKIINDGGQAALDPRLVYDNAVVAENECKAGVCAKTAAGIYMNYPGTTQIIFCDRSTPKKDKFNVYDEVKKYLINNGVDEKHIAFIHDGTTESKKRELLNKLENAEIRIMIGSTSKLGVGVNVQKNLLAIHHLDAPWRPSDLTQREGRLIRPGNQNPEVFIYRYITTQSFDSYLWQLLENKQRFIGSFLSGSLSEFHRSESEIDTVMLDYSEVKALAMGNTLIKDRIQTFNMLERAKISKRQRYMQLGELEEKTEALKQKIVDQKDRISHVFEDKRFYDAHKETMSQEDRAAFGEDLIEAINSNINYDNERYFFDYMGFDVMLPADMKYDDKYITLVRDGGSSYKVDMNDRNPDTVTQAMDGVLIGFSKRIDRLNRVLGNYERELDETYNELEKGNIYDDIVEELEIKLSEIDMELSKTLDKK